MSYGFELGFLIIKCLHKLLDRFWIVDKCQNLLLDILFVLGFSKDSVIAHTSLDGYLPHPFPSVGTFWLEEVHNLIPGHEVVRGSLDTYNIIAVLD